MIAFIDDHRDAYEVKPICRVLPIAPSTYYAHIAQRADPAKASARAQRDQILGEQIRRVHEADFGVYGVRKVWPRPGSLAVAWQGFVYVAFVIDTFARRIVGWRVSRTAQAGFVLNALETEVIRRRGPWRSMEAAGFATLEWVDRFNNRRLFEPIGNMPPAVAEARYYAQLEAPAMAA